MNPPEVAILGITRTEDGSRSGMATTPRPVPMVPLDLSYDHRVINGADAARFLSRYNRADPPIGATCFCEGRVDRGWRTGPIGRKPTMPPVQTGGIARIPVPKGP